MANLTIETKIDHTGTDTPVHANMVYASEFNAVVAFLNKYTILRGIITQTDTNAPELTILENTTGLTFAFGPYGASGNYHLNITGGTVVVNKCLLKLGTPAYSDAGIISGNVVNTSSIFISTYFIVGGSAYAADNLLTKTAIELLIYN